MSASTIKIAPTVAAVVPATARAVDPSVAKIEGSLLIGERKIRARSLLHSEGRPAAETYLLLEGWAFSYRLLRDGRRQILSFLLPGDLACFQALDGRNLRFAVSSITPATVASYDTGRLAAYCASRPEAGARMQELWRVELARCYDRVIDLGRRSAQERVARLLAETFARVGYRAGARTVAFPLRQEHIADALGLTPVHISRTLTALRQEGLIQLTRETLEIEDLDRLLGTAGMTADDLDMIADQASDAREWLPH